MNLTEFRLYYDEAGKVLFYTCDKPKGNFIIIDADTYFQSRFDIKIINNEIVSMYDKKIISKLCPTNIGTSCHYSDISIIHNGPNSKKWSLTLNERS